MNRLFRDLSNFFFPAYCIGCGTRLEGERHFICSHCFHHLPKYDGMEPYYRACDRLAGLVPFTEYHSDLIFQNPGVVRTLIHKIKYHGYPKLAYQLTKSFALHHREQGHFSDVSIVLPIPLTADRLKKRGYNQSLFIARAIAEIYQIQLVHDGLVRSNSRGSQTHRDKEARWHSMQGVFSCTPNLDLSGRRVLIVDDVLTSGATLIQAGQTVIDAGAESVSFYTLALDTLF